MAKGGAASAAAEPAGADTHPGSGGQAAPQELRGEEGDLYVRLKQLQRQLEFLDIQEAYIKDEHKNLKRELLRAQEEVKRIQSVPLVIGQFLELVDANVGIVGSTTGSNFYVRLLSTLNRELLKPGASVALHRHSNALVDILPPEADSSISLLSASEKPDVTYAVRRGLRPGPVGLAWALSTRVASTHRCRASPSHTRLAPFLRARTLAARTCRSRRSGRRWSCRSRTTSCTNR
jgi:hypothetical protein